MVMTGDQNAGKVIIYRMIIVERVERFKYF